MGEPPCSTALFRDRKGRVDQKPLWERSIAISPHVFQHPSLQKLSHLTPGLGLEEKGDGTAGSQSPKPMCVPQPLLEVHGDLKA